MMTGKYLLLLCGVAGVMLQFVHCKKEKPFPSDEFQALFDSIQEKVQFSSDRLSSHSDVKKSARKSSTLPSQDTTSAPANSQNSGQDVAVSGSDIQPSGQQSGSAVQQSSQQTAAVKDGSQPAVQQAAAPALVGQASSDQSESLVASSVADSQSTAAPQAASDSYKQRPISIAKKQETAPAALPVNSGSQAATAAVVSQQTVNNTQAPPTSQPAASAPPTAVQPVAATEKRQQSQAGRSTVVASNANDDDDENDDQTSSRAGDLQPDMFRVFLQMSKGFLPVGCQVDADCTAQKGTVCSRFLNKCVVSPASNSNSKSASNCGPQVCNVDSDCCSGEKCDSYGGLLSRKRCRKAGTDTETDLNSPVSTGALSSSSPTSRSLSGSSNPKIAAAAQDSSNSSNPNRADNSSESVEVQATASLPSKSGSSAAIQDQSQTAGVSANNTNQNQQTSFASRRAAAAGASVNLQSGVSVSSNAGVGSQVSRASNSATGSVDGFKEAQNNQNQSQQQEQDANDQAPMDPAPAKIPEIPLASSPAIQSALAVAKAKTSSSSPGVGVTQSQSSTVQSQGSNGQGIQSSGQEPAVSQSAQSRSLYPGLPVRANQNSAAAPANY